jgi:hypothetical protein
LLDAVKDVPRLGWLIVQWNRELRSVDDPGTIIIQNLGSRRRLLVALGIEKELILLCLKLIF